MDGELWQQADEQIDQVAERIDEILDSPTFDDVRAALAELQTTLRGRLHVSLTCLLEVSDEQHEVPLPLLSMGISADDDGGVYRTWNDSTPQRYLVDGNIRVVPHDRCPSCWNVWDFKWEDRACRHCPAVLGENCRVLLDSDVCPHCEQGKVSLQHPACDRCGWQVDPRWVVWG
jgi:hypothetical protein